MTKIREIKLELVRPGPLHNQLLSPLTSYIALCGEGSPVTVTISMEHRHLLNRLERMRYITPDPHSGQPINVPERFRESELVELGEVIAGILSQVPTLISELAVGGKDILVHLRLVLMGTELALIPFEMAFAPQAFPGEGLAFSLQSSVPVVITREIRRSQSELVAWDERKDTKILFGFAEPAGLSVPARAHAQILREAVEPWVKWPDNLAPGNTEKEHRDFEEDRLKHVKDHLRILPNASIEAIREQCARNDFTHVHILAHGDNYEEAGQKWFGIALTKAGSPGKKHVVTGRQLAEALQAENHLGQSRSQPLVVTLATCDSGNEGSVMVPGGSIAHELHVAGIPWVIASQFPLTIPGSCRLTRSLYRRLLKGDDPRGILFEVRRELHMASEKNHDWTSLIAYGANDPQMDERVANFFEIRTKRAIEVMLDHVDTLTAEGSERDPADKSETNGNDNQKQIKKGLHKVQEYLDMWEKRLPEGDSPDARSRRTECYGIQGSTKKRIAHIKSVTQNEPASKKEYSESRNSYNRAIQESTYHEYRFHWVATQFLSLSALLGDDEDRDLLELARRLADRASKTNKNDEEKAWAFATLAELEVVGLYHDKSTAESEEQRKIENDTKRESAKKAVGRYCHSMLELVDRKTFHVQSTIRQFKRYETYGKTKETGTKAKKTWWSKVVKDVVDVALKELEGKSKGD